MTLPFDERAGRDETKQLAILLENDPRYHRVCIAIVKGATASGRYMYDAASRLSDDIGHWVETGQMLAVEQLLRPDDGATVTIRWEAIAHRFRERVKEGNHVVPVRTCMNPRHDDYQTCMCGTVDGVQRVK